MVRAFRAIEYDKKSGNHDISIIFLKIYFLSSTNQYLKLIMLIQLLITDLNPVFGLSSEI